MDFLTTVMSNFEFEAGMSADVDMGAPGPVDTTY
jgi:hypothetical protein